VGSGVLFSTESSHLAIPRPFPCLENRVFCPNNYFEAPNGKSGPVGLNHALDERRKFPITAPKDHNEKRSTSKVRLCTRVSHVEVFGAPRNVRGEKMLTYAKKVTVSVLYWYEKLPKHLAGGEFPKGYKLFMTNFHPTWENQVGRF